jgi:hypothetical protein
LPVIADPAGFRVDPEVSFINSMLGNQTAGPEKEAVADVRKNAFDADFGNAPEALRSGGDKATKGSFLFVCVPE